MDAPIVPVAPVTPTSPEVKAPAVDSNAKPAVSSDEKPTAIASKPLTEVQKIKLKNGEFTIEEIESKLEKADGADRKFLEAAKQRKEAVKFFKLAKENPREFLAKTGLDPQKFAYDEVAKDIQKKLRDPKDVQIEEAQERLKQYEAKEAAEKEQVRIAKETQAAKAFEAQLHAKMIEALEAAPSLPKNGFTVARIAKYLETVYNKTGTMLDPKDVVNVISKDIMQENANLYKGATAEQLIALIGEEGMAAIRKYDLAKLKDPLKNGGQNNSQPSKPVEHKRVRSNDFWKQIDKDAKAERGQ